MEKEEIVYIQNMLTPRDILSVNNELERLGLKVKGVELGTAAFINTGNLKRKELVKALKDVGYYVLEKKEKEFVDQAKNCIGVYLDKLYSNIEVPLLSDFLEEQMGMSYGRISKQFRKLERRTIENYFISLKVDKVKSLINTTNLSIRDIALRMKYSGPQTLAKTFKETTGLSIYQYKKKDHPGFLMAYGT